MMTYEYCTPPYKTQVTPVIDTQDLWNSVLRGIKTVAHSN